jgi:hypothetical protein
MNLFSNYFEGDNTNGTNKQGRPATGASPYNYQPQASNHHLPLSSSHGGPPMAYNTNQVHQSQHYAPILISNRIEKKHFPNEIIKEHEGIFEGSLSENTPRIHVPKMQVQNGRNFEGHSDCNSLFSMGGPNDQRLFVNKSTNNERVRATQVTSVIKTVPREESVKYSEKLIKNIKLNDEDACRDILSNNLADVNFLSDNNWSPLHFSCWVGNLKITNLLLLAKANFEAKARKDLTPLMIAANSGNIKLLNILIQAGANYRAVDSSGSNLLHYAAKSGSKEMVSAVLDLGVSLEQRNQSGQYPQDVASTSELKEYIKEKKESKEGLIPLFSFTFDKIKKMFTSDDVQWHVLQ